MAMVSVTFLIVRLTKEVQVQLVLGAEGSVTVRVTNEILFLIFLIMSVKKKD